MGINHVSLILFKALSISDLGPHHISDRSIVSEALKPHSNFLEYLRIEFNLVMLLDVLDFIDSLNEDQELVVHLDQHLSHLLLLLEELRQVLMEIVASLVQEGELLDGGLQLMVAQIGVIVFQVLDNREIRGELINVWDIGKELNLSGEVREELLAKANNSEVCLLDFFEGREEFWIKNFFKSSLD